MATDKNETKQSSTDKSSKEKKDVKIKQVADISLDIDFGTMLDLEKNGVSLRFNSESLPSLTTEQVQELSRDSALDYMLAKGEARQREKALRSGRKPGAPKIEMLRAPLDRNNIGKFHVRKDPKFHDYWANPTEVEKCQELGYVVVSDKNAHPNVSDKSTSGIGVIRKADGTGIEHIHMRIPEEKYQEHIKFMSKKSKSRLTTSRSKVKETVEQINRDEGQPQGLKVIDSTKQVPVEVPIESIAE